MNISTKRFQIKSENGVISVRDRTALYRLKTVSSNDIPSAHQMATMTEKQFDDTMEKLIYN